jgi:predicted HTH transcriptional regulator
MKIRTNTREKKSINKNDNKNLTYSINNEKNDLQHINRILKNNQTNDNLTSFNLPIPIKGDKAFISLTDTEVKILKYIQKEGKKTSIEIKNAINLTREHTARLMKKLYIQGYLERRTNKLPYTYELKKEMINLMNNNTSIF